MLFSRNRKVSKSISTIIPSYLKIKKDLPGGYNFVLKAL